MLTMASASDNDGNVATTEEIVAAVMAQQMMPAMQKMFVSSTESALSLAATTAHTNATPATATPASGHMTIPAPATIMVNPAAPSRSTVVSLEASDADVPLESFRRDLTAASDTFLLDHLKDDIPFPTYNALAEPDHVPSGLAPSPWKCADISSTRSAPPPSAERLATPRRP